MGYKHFPHLLMVVLQSNQNASPQGKQSSFFLEVCLQLPTQLVDVRKGQVYNTRKNEHFNSQANVRPNVISVRIHWFYCLFSIRLSSNFQLTNDWIWTHRAQIYVIDIAPFHRYTSYQKCFTSIV